jgi:hypothetical protein
VSADNNDKETRASAQQKKKNTPITFALPHVTAKRPPRRGHVGSGNNPKSRAALIPFAKGFDKRRNIRGKPKSFGQFRTLAIKIASELVTKADGTERTNAEDVLRSWLASAEPQLQRAFVEYAFGKVPDKLDAPALDTRTTLILNYGHEKEKRDAEHDSLAAEVPRRAD